MPGPHLTPFERGQIQAYVRHGLTPGEIAQKLGRSPSTIGRELRRNGTKNGYSAETAQRKYENRREVCRPRRKLDNPSLREYVKRAIGDEEWAPEQVAGRLPLDYPDDLTMRISHETIYQGIYGEDSLHFLVVCLAQARPKRRKKGQGKNRRGPSIPNRVGIEERPEEVEDRNEPGHWEGDTVVGSNQDGFIVTLVERHTRLLHGVKTNTKKAAETAQAVVATLLDRPASWVKTITFDNGTEFAQHELITSELGASIYFADPYAAYQRGTNENTNGLLRRYLPKGRSFKDLTQRQLDMIVEQINNRPRKCLGYRTPNEVFEQHRQERLFALRA